VAHFDPFGKRSNWIAVWVIERAIFSQHRIVEDHPVAEFLVDYIPQSGTKNLASGYATRIVLLSLAIGLNPPSPCLLANRSKAPIFYLIFTFLGTLKIIKNICNFCIWFGFYAYGEHTVSVPRRLFITALQ
jgi:hypothetical protein